jgi:glycerol kinase
VLVNAGSGAPQPVKGLLTTVARSLNHELTYAYEGSIFQSGGIFKWLRDNLGVISDYQEVEELKETEKKTDEVYLVPAFVGLGAPHWRPGAKGAITGLTNQTSRRDIIKAGLEAAAFQVADVLSALPGKVKIKTLKMAGGLTHSRYLAQFQADILGIPVMVSSVTEATALGAARLGAQKLGWGVLSPAGGEIFRPRMNPAERKKLLTGWRSAVKKI